MAMYMAFAHARLLGGSAGPDRRHRQRKTLTAIIPVIEAQVAITASSSQGKGVPSQAAERACEAAPKGVSPVRVCAQSGIIGPGDHIPAVSRQRKKTSIPRPLALRPLLARPAIRDPKANSPR